MLTLAFAFAFSFVWALERFMTFLFANPATTLFRFDPRNLALVKEVNPVTQKGLRIPLEVLKDFLEGCLSRIKGGVTAMCLPISWLRVHSVTSDSLGL